MSKLKLVVVDDDPITRMDIKEMLIQAGYEVIGEGKNGEEAIDLVYRFKPDIVIMDIKMPKMDGIKATRIIRNFKQSAVILLTAYSQRELVNDAKEAGVTGYLVKPVSEEDLIPAIEIAKSQQEQF
ncbi:response regulator, partial [Saccharococcus caldoxylosilyticus]